MAADNTTEQVNNKYKGLSKRGHTNNPGGRPKQPKEFKELVKANTVPALNAVIAIINDPSSKPADKIKAAELIIDRAYGKAAQPIVGDSEHDPVQFDITNPEQRRALIDEYFRTTGAAGDTV